MFIFIGAVGLTFTQNYENIFFYSFSTIVQGFVALVALLGGVVVYKLQIIEGSLNQMADQLRPFLEYYRGAPAKIYIWQEIITESKKILESGKEYARAEIEVVSKTMISIVEDRSNIRSSMVDFSLFTFLTIAFALVGLPLSSIFNGKFLIVGQVYLAVCLLASLYILVVALDIIRLIMGHDFKKVLKK